MREAAENGYDRLSWTPGEAQAARYDVSKQVDGLVWDRDASELRAYDHSGKEVMVRKAGAATLADHIGKEAADKLQKTEPTKSGKHELWGTDLKIGGEGMKGFYDQIIPKAVEKIAKEYGVKAQKGEIRTPGDGSMSGERAMELLGIPEREQGAYWDRHGQTQRSRDALFAKAREKEASRTSPVWYIDIPQKMRDDAVRRGFSLFEDSATAGAPLAALESQNYSKLLDDSGLNPKREN